MGSKKNSTTRKSTKGIPRITAAVLAMDATTQAGWVDGLKNTQTKEALTDAQKADVRARLVKAVANPKSAKGTKAMDWVKTFADRTAEDLVAAQAALSAASATALSEEAKAIAELEARIEQRKAALKSATAGQTVTA